MAATLPVGAIQWGVYLCVFGRGECGAGGKGSKQVCLAARRLVMGHACKWCSVECCWWVHTAMACQNCWYVRKAGVGW